MQAATGTYKRRQPQGVYLLFVLQILGMVAFSFLLSLLALYCTTRLGFNDHSAYAIVAAFNALTFSLSVPGGWLAERFLGFRFGTTVSIVLIAVGIALMAIKTHLALYLGLGIFLMGVGMNVPCLYVLLGRLYKEGDTRREGGFVLSYIGMNVGSFLASAVSGSLSLAYSYSSVFIIGAIFTLLMIPIFLKAQSLFKLAPGKAQRNFTVKTKSIGIALTILMSLGTVFLVKYAEINNALIVILGVASVIFVLKVAFSHGKVARNKLLVFLALTIVSVAFWALYQLSPSAIILFMQNNVNRTVMGWNIPSGNLIALNPFFIITMGPIVSWLWMLLARRNIKISIPKKFSFGIILMGVGYLVLVLGIKFATSAGVVALIWIVLSYFFQTVGELFVGPVGYSMVGELVPAKDEGTMMGIWQLACGIAGALSEYLANFTTTPSTSVHDIIATDIGYSHAFSYFGWITVAVGVAAFLVAPALQRISDTKGED